METYLAMFDAAGPHPFKPQPQAYTPRSEIDRILELHRKGIPIAKIAEEIGKHPSTIYRHIQRAETRGD